jgi:hypothetical protein
MLRGSTGKKAERFLECSGATAMEPKHSKLHLNDLTSRISFSCPAPGELMWPGSLVEQARNPWIVWRIRKIAQVTRRAIAIVLFQLLSKQMELRQFTGLR